jgi:hypothetical protein
MLRVSLVTAACLTFLTIGCESDDRDGNESSGGRAAGGGSGGSGGTGGGAPKCDGAFATVPSPYAPNTTTNEWGGFAVDERGAVFSAIADESLTNDTNAFPGVIMASDLAGNVTTLHTDDGSSMFGSFALGGDSVYMLAGLLTPGIVRLDRSGGEPVEVVEGPVFAGPILRDDFIYYAKRGVADFGIYLLDPETDASTELIVRQDQIDSLDLDGDTLYWIESDGLLADTDYRLFEMPAGGGSAELVQSLPRGALALGSFRVVDGVLFGSEITEDYDIVLTRTPIGGAPTVVEDSGGLPMVIDGGYAYYGSLSGGLVKAPLSFASKMTIPGSSGRAIYSLALGPQDLWYSEVSCIYRTAK